MNPQETIDAYIEGVRQGVLAFLQTKEGQHAFAVGMLDGTRAAVESRVREIEKRKMAETTGGGLLAKP